MRRTFLFDNILNLHCFCTKENCNNCRTFNLQMIQFLFFYFSDVCDDSQKLLNLLTISRSYIIGSLEPSLCALAQFMSSFYNTTLLTWNCPQVKKKNKKQKLIHKSLYNTITRFSFSLFFFYYFKHIQVPNFDVDQRTINLGPSITQIVQSFSRLVSNMKWKSIAIISSSKLNTRIFSFLFF